MAAPANWYPVSTEPGILRYWDGDQWTEHRMPNPAAAAPAQAPAQIEAAYVAPVRQEPAYVAPVRQEPAYQAPQTYATPSFGQPAEEARAIESRPDFGAVDIWSASTEDDDEDDDFETPQTVNRGAGGATASATSTPASTTFDTAARARVGVRGAAGIIGFGLLFVAFAGLNFSQAPDHGAIGASETKAAASVTFATPATDGTCLTIATFQVDGSEYTAGYRMAPETCVDKVGAATSVAYDKTNIQATARIIQAPELNIFGLALAGTGVLAIAGGVWAFIRRAGSLSSGLTLLVTELIPAFGRRK